MGLFSDALLRLFQGFVKNNYIHMYLQDMEALQLTRYSCNRYSHDSSQGFFGIFPLQDSVLVLTHKLRILE